MASAEVDSRFVLTVNAALDKIIKNASWRKHSKLVQECKSLVEKLSAGNARDVERDEDDPEPAGPLHDGSITFSVSDSQRILSPLIEACSSGVLMIVDPAVDCIQKLIAQGSLRSEADKDGSAEAKLLFKLIECVCKCHDLGDECVELVVLKTLLSAIMSTSLGIHGDCLLLVVRTCYNIYLGSKNVLNQTTAKASLIQMLVVVFRRMEADSFTVPIQPIVVADLMDPTEKSGSGDASTTQLVQGFITKIVQDIDVVLNPSPSMKVINGHDGSFKTAVDSTDPMDLLNSSTDKDLKEELENGEGDGEDEDEVQIGNKLRTDAFLVFRTLCKLAMKTPPKDAPADTITIRGKIVALELLKILLENAGIIFRTSKRFLGAIKQYLCVSLLKNSSSSQVIVFQLSCSIVISLVSRFRAGLKAEIGIFFPMIVLRVLENPAQPNFQQKMIVLRFMQRLCVDSQILVDIFINYDCDVHSSNIFERMVNGLLRIAQGVPAGASASLLPPQESTLKLEAMKCLVAISISMGDWMNKQLSIPDPSSVKRSEEYEKNAQRTSNLPNGDAKELRNGLEPHVETTIKVSEDTTFEQGHAQEGVLLFNRNPRKGIEFLIKANKLEDSPEEIASFLKKSSDLNKTTVGDYLGEREGLPRKAMHAYVDSFDFHGMEFDEAIRCFLQGFRLPGEAQKIDCIMEKFAERFCKCNPTAFASANTAYILAYSVILLNIDAHNPTTKDKMSPDDFIRNNHGIDDGKDLPEEYLRSLYERISQNEIKMKEDEIDLQQQQAANPSRILGFDSILNIVICKKGGKKLMETSYDYMKHVQELFKEKAHKTESVYYAATDVVILRFMIEVSWAPMLAAFSMPFDQSQDEAFVSQCIEGFHHAIHVTAVMRMHTQRDAFVRSLAKFTSLHSAVHIKQRNIDAIKALVAIADEDGNYLEESWEHILTCVSRFEHLHLLGEVAPPDARLSVASQIDLDKSKQSKSVVFPVLKNEPGRHPNASTAVRRGSYDSAVVGGDAFGAVTNEQMNKLLSNLNLLEKVGEMNRIFVRSQQLNGEAIVDFVKSLCKVSMDELRSTSSPGVFSLTKIIEIAHYNMNRIKLVWSGIWNVLADYFVNIGCSENLPIAIFAMDSLRQLAMKFLEREELANYNFQNEFMKPFVIVMRKSSSVEIRELIIRCVSQMVFTRINNIKSGWKSMFMVFTTAAYDGHKNIVNLAFEIIEKIVRGYFSHITETETTFTNCVNCLVVFTNSRLNKDISFNAIAILQFCAAKLSEGDARHAPSSPHGGKNGNADGPHFTEKDSHLYLWFPLLAGLSELTFDSRIEIREKALQVLFDALKNQGHVFSLALWERVFDSVLFPIFDYVRRAINPSADILEGHDDLDVDGNDQGQDVWFYETCTPTLRLVVDIFVKFYNTVNPLLKKVLLLLVSFIKLPHQSLAGVGLAALVRLMFHAGDLFSEEKWLEVVLSLKEAFSATLPDFSRFLTETSGEESSNKRSNGEIPGSAVLDDETESSREESLYLAVADIKCRTAIQLLLIQAIMEIYGLHKARLSTKNTLVLFDALHSAALHAHVINRDTTLRSKIRDLGSVAQMQDPPLLRLEKESYLLCLTLLQDLTFNESIGHGETGTEGFLVDLCKEVLHGYLSVAQSFPQVDVPHSPHCLILLGPAKRKELSARAPLVVSTLQALTRLEESSFEKKLAQFFPLLCSLIRSEHGSGEVQAALCAVLTGWVGPILLRSC